MRAWQHPDLDGDLTHVPEAAAIRAHPLFDDPLAHAVLDLLVEQLAENVRVFREALAQLGDGALAQLVDSGLAGGLVRIEGGLVEPKGEVLAHHLDDLSRKRRRGVLNLGLPTSRCSSSCPAHTCLIASCAISSASSTTCSDTPFAPASTMRMASAVPATTRSSSDSPMRDMGGLTTIWPSRWPMRTAPTGPANGMSEITSAVDAPLMLRIVGSFSWSTESTVETTWTSSRNPSGNSGRRGRSVRRDARIAASLGRPSRRMNAPGILPAAYSLSS